METKILNLHPRQDQNYSVSQGFIPLMKEFAHYEVQQNELSPHTERKFSFHIKNIENFLENTGYHQASIADINTALLMNFTQWMKENLESCSRTHIYKHINLIKRSMAFAKNKGYITENIVSDFRYKRDKHKKIIYLKNEELEEWKNTKWVNNIYNLVQELSVMQAYTGLSYMDLFTYETTILNGKLWIIGTRGKGIASHHRCSKEYYIPLFHKDFVPALEIHNKYNGKLPKIGNHHYNRIIKEMSKTLFNKSFKSHHFRKTCATHKSANGWGIPGISAMLGNSEKVCEQDYVQAGIEKVMSQIKKLG